MFLASNIRIFSHKGSLGEQRNNWSTSLSFCLGCPYRSFSSKDASYLIVVSDGVSIVGSDSTFMCARFTLIETVV